MTVLQLETSTRTTTAATLGDLTYSTMPAGLDALEVHAYRVGFDRGARSFGKTHPGAYAVTHAPLTGDSAPAPGTAARRQLGVTLAMLGKAYRAERHPVAHKAGMAELVTYWSRHGLEDRATRYGCKLRKITRKAGTGTRTKELERAIASGEVAYETVAEDVTPLETVAPAVTVVDVDAWPSESDRAAVAEIVESGGRVELLEPVSVEEVPAELLAVVTAGEIPDPARGRRAARRALAAVLRDAGMRAEGDTWRAACELVGLTPAAVTA